MIFGLFVYIDGTNTGDHADCRWWLTSVSRMLLNTTSFSARIQKNNTKCIFVCVHKKKLAKPVPLVLCGSSGNCNPSRLWTAWDRYHWSWCLCQKSNIHWQISEDQGNLQPVQWRSSLQPKYIVLLFMDACHVTLMVRLLGRSSTHGLLLISLPGLFLGLPGHTLCSSSLILAKHLTG